MTKKLDNYEREIEENLRAKKVFSKTLTRKICKNRQRSI